MVAPPSTYGEVWLDGNALRGRLAGQATSVEMVTDLVRDVRDWQVRCSSTVARRDPSRAIDFEKLTGAYQGLVGEWFPTPGWQLRLDDRLVAWLTVIDWLRLLNGSRGLPEN